MALCNFVLDSFRETGRGSRWSGLLGSVTLSTAAGSSYAFAVYSESLKHATGFDQLEIQTM